MFVIPGIIALFAYVYIHPQEVYESLRVVTVPMLVALAAFGYVLDLRLGNTGQRRPTLMLWLAIAFWTWAILTVAIVFPDSVIETISASMPSIAVFLALAIGVSTLRGLRIVTMGLLSITMLIGVIAIDQGLTPPVCVLPESNTEVHTEVRTEALPGDTIVGKPCQARLDCDDGTGREYDCEHLGLMKTSSVARRVRYRGVLQDPNELAWTLSLALPFAFAWFERRQAKGGFLVGHRIVVAAVLVACIVCNVMTQSRSGQLSLLATLGVYFIGRFGWRGIAAAAVVAAPVLLFGGRTDESSTEERLECWSEALSLWREHPVVGAGARHFVNYHHLTAHNSVLLTLAEMGPLGLVLFTALMYVALKTMLRARHDLTGRPEAAEARAFAFASAAALIGTMVSAFFLSIAYHTALWIAFGLAAAVQATVSRHDPQWRMAWGWRDVGAVVGLDVAIVTGIAIYLRYKGL
jgi:hypothetical protein